MRNKMWFILAISFSLALSGCMLGPNYVRPSSQVPAEWKADSDPKKEVVDQATQTILDEKWWMIFNDETLNGLIKLALESSQSLKSAAARVIQARAIARVSRSELWPNLSTNPTFSRSQQSGNRFQTSQFEQPSGFLSNSFRMPFDLSYELDIWGRVRRSFESSRAQAVASLEEYRTILLTLTADIARSYFFVRALDGELEILDQTKELRERGLTVVNDRFQAGLVSELDLARAKTELASVEVETLDFGRRREELINTLALLCGQPASTFIINPKPLDLIPPPIPAGLPSTLLERRPDVLQAENLMQAANAEIGVAKAAFFPSISLTSSAGYESFELKDLFDWDSRAWSLGSKISLPLFLGGRNKANLEATKARYEESVAKYRQQILIAFKEVEDALVNVKFRDEQVKAQEKLLEAAKEAGALSIERYKEGLVTFLEVVDAERSRLQAETERIQFKAERIASTVLLIKALGGGWSAMDPDSAKNKPPLKLISATVE